MNKTEIQEFMEKIKEIPFSNLKDPVIMGALGDLYVTLGDIFTLRIPKYTKNNLSLDSIDKFNRRRAR